MYTYLGTLGTLPYSHTRTLALDCSILSPPSIISLQPKWSYLLLGKKLEVQVWNIYAGILLEAYIRGSLL